MNWFLYIILLVVFLYVGYLIIFNSRKAFVKKDLASIDSNDVDAIGETPSNGKVTGVESDEDIVKTKSIEEYYKKKDVDGLIPTPTKQKANGKVILSAVSRTRCLSTDVPIANIPMNYASQSKTHLR